MDLDLQMPLELKARVEALAAALERRRVGRMSVFSYGRPGEPTYWLAYLFVEGARHVLGTPDLRHRPLEEQLDDLLQQLSKFLAVEPDEGHRSGG